MLSARSISKRFPGVLAVDRLDFDIAGGEIVALLGQNGAGKSTFMQILAGVHPAGSYEGEITLDGRAFRPASVAAAEAAGVALVPQETAVAPDLTVAESLFLNAEPTRFGMVDRPARLAEARRVLSAFEVHVDASAAVGTLDLATQQLLVIARALSKNARLLILDEPTAALTEEETRRLFARLRALRQRGLASIFVSHRLAEVFEISDRVVVMRDGRQSGAYSTAAASRDQVVRAMLGTAAPPAGGAGQGGPRRRASTDQEEGTARAPTLEVRDLVVEDPRFRRRPPVDGVSLRVSPGEIVGLFGLLGAGCGELAAALFGAWEGPVRGSVYLDGRAVRIRRPGDAVAHGLGLVAQDRRASLLPEHSIAENIALASLPALTRGGFLDLARLRRQALDYMARLRIKAPDIDTLVGTLSGGNQQKVQVARWLASGAKILLLVDPTRGIDVGARQELTQLWRRLAAEGHTLIVASTDAEELVDLCDRVVVLRNGKVAAELERSTGVTEERLLRAAAGV
jgi:ABC-type sugar transport system ATPase subunit